MQTATVGKVVMFRTGKLEELVCYCIVNNDHDYKYYSDNKYIYSRFAAMRWLSCLMFLLSFISYYDDVYTFTYIITNNRMLLINTKI